MKRETRNAKRETFVPLCLLLASCFLLLLSGCAARVAGGGGAVPLLALMPLMLFAVSANARRNGKRFALLLTGLVASAAISMVVLNDGTVTVTQTGNGSDTVALPEGISLVPGSGFSGALVQPDDVGTGEASTEFAIARWNVVPYQTYSGAFKVGVVAFHIRGIDHVDFYADGGSPLTVSSAALNDESGTVEYWCLVDPAVFGDGPHEIRAIVYPVAGRPRVLQGGAGNDYASETWDGICSLVVNTNYNGTLTSASVTISDTDSLADVLHTLGTGCNGGTVYLNEGSYSFASPAWYEEVDCDTFTRWLTIMPAPGADPANISIGSNNDLIQKLVRMKGLNLTRGSVSESAARANAGKIAAVWYDDCHATGSDRFSDQSPWGINGARGGNMRFATNCTIATMDDGFDSWNLVRGCDITLVAAGFWRNVGLCVNNTGDTIDSSGHPEIHPDSYQHSSGSVGGTTPWMNNTIVYGCTATDGAFIRTTTVEGQVSTNMAMVNCQWLYTSGTGLLWDLGPTSYTNIYVLYSTFGRDFTVYEGFTPTDFVFEDCTFLTNSPSGGVVIR